MMDMFKMTSEEVLEKILEKGFIMNSSRRKAILQASGEGLKQYAIKYGVYDNRTEGERRFQNAVSCYRAFSAELIEMGKRYETHDLGLGEALTGEYVEPEGYDQDMARIRQKKDLIQNYLVRHGEEDGGFASADLMWRWIRG